jgi:hypothetical protein
VKIVVMRKLVVVCLVAACGSSDPMSSDAAVPDTPAADTPADTAAAARHGIVQVTQGDTGTGNTGQVGAGFIMGADIMGPVMATDGPCTSYGSMASPATLDAGTIMISGTLSPVTLTPSGSPLEYQAGSAVPYPLFSEGSTITITGAGGADIPAFNGTVTAPADVAGFTKPTSLSRAGYTVTWTAGSGPGMWVLLVAIDASFNGVPVICRVPDTGSFAIPASTFALLPAADTMGGVAVARVVESEVAVTDTSIALVALSEDSTSIIPLTQ